MVGGQRVLYAEVSIIDMPRCRLLRYRNYTGFDRTRLGGYLDLFWVMMNPPRDKMEKAAFVLDRAMRNPKTLRYRDFYARSPSSDDEESSS